MGLISLIFHRRKKPIPAPRQVLSGSAGSSFTFGDIRKNPTVQACTNVIANVIGILPLNLFFKNPKDGSRQRAGWHPIYSILRQRPNPSESPVIFFGKMIRHIIQKGNSYLFQNRDSTGKLLSLHLLNPEYVTEVYDGLLVSYRYNGDTYTGDEVLHISGLITDDQGKGYSLVDLAKVAVLLGIQLDEYSLASFGNGLNTKLLLDIAEMTAGNVDLEQAQKIAQTVADYVRRNYAGAENAGKPLILWNGMKATELKNQSSNRDAELLESRKWQELEICKIFGVPPFLINGTYEVKYGGLEQAMTVFLNFTLAPYLRHIEQRLSTLLTSYEQDAYYFEFDFNVLLRTDEKSRGDFYSKLFGMGAISPAMIAARENLEPPTEGGDARFVPANLMPLRIDVLDAYMAGAKLKAAALIAGAPLPDPTSAAGDQAQ
ncbi:MAG: phage portal protein [Spirochaetes bacterium]|nr:phage portal protein [Spirochaetota bacterium]